jgi:NAD(P)-dependent dehydrogenase (short-subunit alcohol dehydrogenase family)
MGRIIVLTGATSEIGKVVTADFAKSGNTVIIITDKAKEAKSLRLSLLGEMPSAKITVVETNYTDFRAAKNLVFRLQALVPYIDVLINLEECLQNTFVLSNDGIEKNFAYNYLAPFMLIQGTLHLLRRSRAPRVINVSSMAANYVAKLDMDNLCLPEKFDAQAAYRQSKFGLLLLTKFLAKEFQKEPMTINAIHPGAINGDIFKHWNPFRLPNAASKEEIVQKAAEGILYLATSMEVATTSGSYYYNNQITSYPVAATDENLAKRFYKKSLDWVETPILMKNYRTA